MPCVTRATTLLALTLTLAPVAAAQRLPRPVPTPSSVLGFPPGEDRRLTDWATIVRYFRALDAASPRVSIRELGRTTNGAPFIAAFISSPANLARLPALAEVQRRLADPRLSPDSTEVRRLLARTPAFVLITSSVHSTEVGGYFSPLVIAHHLATTTDPTERRILDNAIVMLVPSMNPDGVDIVSRWYAETLGTPAEGAGPPELYHPYVGHDNNRDWYAFTQVETRLVVDSLYGVWHPQVTMDIHQQGQYGSRIFVPPYLDPHEPNVDPILVQGVNALGMEIARRLTADGLAGVAVSSSYDAWTPARAFQHYHGAVRILTETASAALATPVTIPFDSLRADANLDPRRRSWNFVAPWPGGRWTLADIVRYQTAGAMAMLDHVGRSADQWRRASRLVAERAVRGWPDWPWAYVLPTAGQDQAALNALLAVLQRGQVEVRQALQAFTLEGERLSAGAYVVVLRQPYAAFAKTLLERQFYPDLREYPGGPPQRPYDVTAHTLPLLFGVRTIRVEDSLAVPLSGPVMAPPPVFRAARLSTTNGRRSAVRIGVYRSWAPSMDEGWTRWTLDTWAVPFESLTDSVVRAGGLAARYDAIIIPDQPARTLLEGLSARRYPVRLVGGLGQAGVAALKEYVDAGGTLITFNEASRFAIGALDLPVTDVLATTSSREFYAPGSILRLQLEPDHPVTEGMGTETIAWFEDGPAFEPRDPFRVRVLGRYPAAASDILLSGYLLGPTWLAGRAGLVEVRRGRGRVLLFGFRPQYRGQSLATLPLLFNALRSAAREGR
jgi:hypothetical protein